MAGRITVTTAAGGVAGSTFAVTFNQAYATIPSITVTPTGAVAPTLTTLSAVATTGFTISCTTPAGAVAIGYHYQVVGIQVV
jgi:hypothetical protein